MNLDYVTTISDLSYEDILDSRDLEELLSYVEDSTDDDSAALEAELRRLKRETEDEGWKYGIIFIRDSYFRDYAQQLAEDLDLMSTHTSWPYTCIDWEWAARELQHDYLTASCRRWR